MASCGFRGLGSASQLQRLPMSQKILLLPGGSEVACPIG